jgi:hypothetical protein
MITEKLINDANEKVKSLCAENKKLWYKKFTFKFYTIYNLQLNSFIIYFVLPLIMNVVEFGLMAIWVYYKTKLEIRSVLALFKNTIYLTKMNIF